MRKEIEELVSIKVIKRIIRNYGKGRKPMINTANIKKSNNQKEVLSMNSSKLSTARRFPMSIMWYIFAGWLLSLSLIFIILFQNHVEWIFPAFFNCLHLYAKWWFSWQIISEMKGLPANFSWLRFSDLLRTFFLSIRMLHFCFLDLNFAITRSFFSDDGKL